jgi:hypothetical protein
LAPADLGFTAAAGARWYRPSDLLVLEMFSLEGNICQLQFQPGCVLAFELGRAFRTSKPPDGARGGRFSSGDATTGNISKPIIPDHQ